MVRWLTLPRLVTALTFLAIFAMAARVSVDTDTWWHLRTGQWIMTHGAIPQTDPFSFTRQGVPWRIPGWLAQAPLYVLFERFGYGGLNLVTAGLVTLTFALVYPACTGHPLLRAFTLVLAAAASGIYWSARPQIVSLVLAAAFALILYQYRWRRVNRLWLLPPLMAVWANVHGGFAIGFILIGLTLAGQVLAALGAWRRYRPREEAPGAPLFIDFTPTAAADLPNRQSFLWLSAILAACVLAVALNPAGAEMLTYPFKTVGIGALRDFIQEWQSPNFHNVETQPFLWLLLATFVAVAFSGRRPDATDVVLVLGLAYLGFLAGRNMPLLAVVAPPLLTRHADALVAVVRQRLRPVPAPDGPPAGEAPPAADFPALNWLLLLVLAGGAALKVAAVLPAEVNERELARFTPLAAARFIQQTHPPGPLFNSYNFGAYLTWALYPDYPVYVDGRTDLYDDAFLREYLDVALGRPGYAAAFDRAGIRLVLIEADSLLADRLRENLDWHELYRDEVAVVFGRR
ncbi:MAG: hypothetical protein JNK29_03665 [Anaerolineales bacterium]|nr:hypothetical protein [Anaerolineales bacterium]